MNWLDCFDQLTGPISEACKALRTVTNHLSLHPEIASSILENVFHPNASKFLQRLENDAINEEYLLCALKIIDDTLECLFETTLTAKQIEVYLAIGDTLLLLLYQSRTQVPLAAKNPTLFALTTLSIFNKILVQCTDYMQVHISELLGVARFHVHFGLTSNGANTQIKPQKVQPSQQLPAESSADEQDALVDNVDAQKARCATGGKLSKKRKPRSLAKGIQSASQINQQRWRTLELDNFPVDIKTSDSDASEVETGLSNAQQRSCSLQERQNCAKVRQAAINLFSVIATKVQDRRLLYAYWNGFFENVKIPSKNTNRSDLLFIALHDPNTRCRSLALQVAAQLIFNSKHFLQQAECIEQRCPSTFTPFSHNLGFQVLSLFEEIIQVLACESSLAVLTQALKCLAVLVQATTPFKRFQPRHFVLSFVNEVRRLTCHRDPIVQVSALMVMEFLIATPELTLEISQALGTAHKIAAPKEKRLNDVKVAQFVEFDNSFDEFLESDDEEKVNDVSSTVAVNSESTTITHVCDSKTEMSWLLKRSFQYLNAFPTQCNLNLGTSISVRVECFQILSAMSQHFNLLRNHLELVANSIENALKDITAEIRICGARCLDTIANRIGQTLLEQVTDTDEHNKMIKELEDECISFWQRLLPIIMSHISVTTDIPTTFKVCLCDSLSNMGVIIFERQSFTLQMNLISFLSGIANDPNEEITVRTAAVRALAVYVLFPSLHDNLVFVENTAEAALRLASDSNLIVRIKALWALGNISDALLNQSNNSKERISNDLLWRMISAATNACSDNDKVRCNAVRTLGNLLRLLSCTHFDAHNSNQASTNNHDQFKNAIFKLIDCLRTAGSAKVKWNTCYAIGNLLQNSVVLFQTQQSTIISNFDWQSKLFPTLANVIVNHANFKVRINATTALTRVSERSHFGVHFELLCKALLDAIEQSHHLDNFYEYNHRDQLQEQLCLALCHLVKLSLPDDFLIFHKYIELRFEVIRNICCRVANRMVPEKSAPILSCTAFLQQQLKNECINYTNEQRKAINYLIKTFDSQ